MLAVLADGDPGDARHRPRPKRRPTRRAREDLEAVRERHAIGLDAARPDAVAKRHEQGRRTARENLADLVDQARSSSTGR